MKVIGTIDDLTLYKDAAEALSIMTDAVRMAQEENWKNDLPNIYYDQIREEIYYMYPDGRVVWEKEEETQDKRSDD